MVEEPVVENEDGDIVEIKTDSEQTESTSSEATAEQEDKLPQKA